MVRLLTPNATPMAGDRERCLAAGMDGYVPKPIRKEELMREKSRLIGPHAHVTAVA